MCPWHIFGLNSYANFYHGYLTEFFEPVLIRVGVGMSEPLEFVWAFWSRRHADPCFAYRALALLLDPSCNCWGNSYCDYRVSNISYENKIFKIYNLRPASIFTLFALLTLISIGSIDPNDFIGLIDSIQGLLKTWIADSKWFFVDHL